MLLLLLTSWVAAAPAAAGTVSLEWRQEPGVVHVGDIVRIGLYAVSDDPGANQSMAGLDVILSWDNACLQLLGVENNGPYAWLFSGFPAADPFGLNEQVPPQDGDGLYLAQGDFVLPEATPDGLLVTTFRFRALAGTCGTVLGILEAAGTPLTQTVVWSGVMPGTPITGVLGALTLAIDSGPCPFHGDMNCDGMVDGQDVAPFVLAIIDPAAYAAGYNCDLIRGDMNDDGLVDVGDLGPLLDALLGTCGALKGDVNCDRVVDGLDIRSFVRVTLGQDSIPGHFEAADLDDNGVVDTGDLLLLTNMLIAGGDILEGDVNGDGVVDGLDVRFFAMVMLGQDLIPEHFDAADLDGNGIVDAGDLLLFTDLLMYGGAPLMGDVNGDRVVDGLDVRFFMRVALGQDQDPKHVRAADFDGNGIVDEMDLYPFILTLMDWV